VLDDSERVGEVIKKLYGPTVLEQIRNPLCDANYKISSDL